MAHVAPDAQVRIRLIEDRILLAARTPSGGRLSLAWSPGEGRLWHRQGVGLGVRALVEQLAAQLRAATDTSPAHAPSSHPAQAAAPERRSVWILGYDDASVQAAADHLRRSEDGADLELQGGVFAPEDGESVREGARLALEKGTVARVLVAEGAVAPLSAAEREAWLALAADPRLDGRLLLLVRDAAGVRQLTPPPVSGSAAPVSGPPPSEEDGDDRPPDPFRALLDGLKRR